MAEFLRHEPCPSCGSKDNLGRWSDNSAYCFGCSHYEPGNESEDMDVNTFKKTHKPNKQLISSYPINKTIRGIRPETFEFFGYRESVLNNERVHVAHYYENGECIAQKIRNKDKKFHWRGNVPKTGLYGSHLWGDKGKRIVITEGELDCLSISQVQDNKWPVVSLKNGAQGAKKELLENLEWLENFEEILLCFDSDKPGQDAIEECSEIFTPGKVKIVRLPTKDANELLQKKPSELVRCLWNAKAIRPQGVFSGLEIIEQEPFEVRWGLEFPWETMTKATFGMRPHEMIAYGAGTGVGKTDTLKHIIAHLIKNNEDIKIGTMFLEEPMLSLTLTTIGGIHNKKIYHVPGVKYDPDERRAIEEKIAHNLELFKPQGSVEIDEILKVIRYMVIGLGCSVIFLDHITYVLDGISDSDRVAAMKRFMKKLNDLNKELPFTLHYVSHLRKSKVGGKPHEEGGRVVLDDFEGGKASTQYANFVFALERDQQNPENKDITIVRCLKDRYTGQGTGMTFALEYDPSTGTKQEVKGYENEDEKESESNGYADAY